MFKRGVKEAVWERVEELSLNRRGGLRFKLSRVTKHHVTFHSPEETCRMTIETP